MNILTLFTLLIVFVASLIRSTFGFGFALVGMPLLALTIGVQTATPLAGLIGTTIATLILWGSWQKVDFGASWQLIISSLIGIPVGIFILKAAPEPWVKGILGIVIILFSLYNLVRPKLMLLQQTGWSYLFGFIAGVMGGAYNTAGPPVIIYGALRRWPPVRFRATMQGYFFPVGLFTVVGHALAGLWTGSVLQIYLFGLPLVLAATFLGARLNQRIPTEQFQRIIYLVLIILGFLLLI